MDTISTNSTVVTHAPYTEFVDWLAERGISYEQWTALPYRDSCAYVRAWLGSPHPVHQTTRNAMYFTILTEPDKDLKFRLIPTWPPAKSEKPAPKTAETTNGIHAPAEYTDPDPGNIPIGLAGHMWTSETQDSGPPTDTSSDPRDGWDEWSRRFGYLVLGITVVLCWWYAAHAPAGYWADFWEGLLHG